MENQLTELERKIQQVAQLCDMLRLENRVLRNKLQASDEHAQQIAHKLAQTKARVSALLESLPKDAA